MALLAVTAAPIAALADYNYTFNVPVTLSNLSAGSVIYTECNLYAGANASGASLTGSEGSSATPVNGSYSGTLTVKLVSTVKPASYECWLIVNNTAAPNVTVNIQNGLPNVPANGWTGTQFTIGAIQ